MYAYHYEKGLLLKSNSSFGFPVCNEESKYDTLVCVVTRSVLHTAVHRFVHEG